MKSTIRKFLFAGVLLVATLSACRKDNTTTTTTTTPTGTPLAEDQAKIQAFFDAHRPQGYTFTFDAATGYAQYSPKGNIIIIQANAFLDANGNVVTGNITATFDEYGAGSEMILADKPTVTADGQILETAGEFRLQAQSASTSELYLAPNTVTVIVPVDSFVGPNQAMQGWVGDTSYQYVISGRNYQNVPATMTYTTFMNPGILWSQANNLSITPASYDLVIDSLGNWTNVDVILTLPGTNRTTLFAYMDQFNDSTAFSTRGIAPSMLFFKPDGLSSLIKMSSQILNPPSGYAGFHSYQNIMPVGLTGKYLAITTKNGKFYAELKTNTAVPAPINGANYSFLNFTMPEVTEAQLLALINSMN